MQLKKYPVTWYWILLINLIFPRTHLALSPISISLIFAVTPR